MGWISYLLHRDTQQHWLWAKYSTKGEQSSSWKGHRGSLFLPFCWAWNTCRWAAKARLPGRCSGHPRTVHLPQRSVQKAGAYLGLPFISPTSLRVEDSSEVRQTQILVTCSAGLGSIGCDLLTCVWQREMPGPGPLQSELGRDLASHFQLDTLSTVSSEVMSLSNGILKFLQSFYQHA